jgi:hypothetical protein
MSNLFANIGHVNNFWRVNMSEFFCAGCMSSIHEKFKSEKVNASGKPLCCDCVIRRTKSVAEERVKTELAGDNLTQKQGRQSKPRKWREIEAKKEDLALRRLMSDDYLMI